MITKEVLRDSKSCRFCGKIGEEFPETPDQEGDTSKEGPVAAKYSLTFIPIYEMGRPKVSMESQQGVTNPIEERMDDETLGSIINRYLPIKVSENDSYYPRFICSNCHTSLLDTVKFFDTIIEGQRLLMKIINYSIASAKSLVGEITSGSSTGGNITTQELVYSHDQNVVLQNLPKKRGRPRKDDVNYIDKSLKRDIVSSISSSSEIHTKPKRISRPPQRYSAMSVELKQELPEEIPTIEKDPYLMLGKLDSLTAIEAKSESLPFLIEIDAARRATESRNVLELDVKSLETDARCDKELGHVQVLDSTNVEPDDQSQSQNIDSNSNAAKDEDNDNDNDNEDCLIIQEDNCNSSENGNDSDASIRTIDIITHQTKLKPQRNRRKRRKVLGSSRAGRAKHKSFKCADCDKLFLHRTSLRYHQKTQHGDPAHRPNHICELCGKPFVHKHLLAAHLHSHSNKKLFKCDVCVAKFKSKSSLCTHKRSVHNGGKKPFSCDVCGNRFTLKSSLKSHGRLHTNEKPYSCEFCHKLFTQRSNLMEHRRIHTGERPYLCSWTDCGKKFAASSQLRAHTLIHNKTKLYYCDICGRGMSHSVGFKNHMKRHRNEKDLECIQCGKRFVDAWSLKIHFRIHTGEKPYKCEICKRTFNNRGNFVKHKKVHLKNDDESVSYTTNEESKDAAVEDTTESEIATGLEDREISIPIEIQFDNSVVTGLIDNTGSFNVSDQTNGLAGSFAISAYSQSQSDIRDVQNTTEFILTEDTGQIANMNENDQQVIYIYPENLPIFTVTLDENQAVEVHGSDGSYQMLGSLDQIAFATVDGDEFGTQYLNLEVGTFHTTASSAEILESSIAQNLTNEAFNRRLSNPNLPSYPDTIN